MPVETKTVFQIQSVTKTFTAAAIMMLVSEGKLQLDDKINKSPINKPPIKQRLPLAWRGSISPNWPRAVEKQKGEGKSQKGGNEKAPASPSSLLLKPAPPAV